MSDSLGDGRGNPTATQIRLYERWAQGGAALSLIGEVQVDPRFPEKPGNLVLGPTTNRAAVRELTHRAAIDDAHIWPQLGHAGALAHPPLSMPKGPSPLDVEGLRCEGMSAEEVAALPAQYAEAAAQAKALGFTGVQIHAGHGFLLSQFLSPLFNQRSDAWGGDVRARTRVVVEIVAAVRQQVGPAFPVGIKINTSDQLVGGLTADEGLEVVRILDGTSLDLIEFSGGTYFPGAPSASDSLGGGPYFIDFARRARPLTRKPLVTTGGFKTRDQVVEAVASGVTDAVGLARALVLDPALPARWISAMNEEVDDPSFPRFRDPPPEGITAWYTQRLTAIGEDEEGDYGLSLQEAIAAYQGRDQARVQNWRERFE
ncbi:2,4-dienoyl-CoA reductase-like NADH-dependent reductase (Old Yellow Enzyme family) [Natronocella acetinitrilica]|uniref:2,4-dienoyl-CoA reductase-like NADH-dependent reductase (Old Yellow Enzyme family) n=2 Tax=Natronocella acetinitrilica TaxID=414046 RepID=A0AAE3G8J1_9GAMM|nr:2,4-dienoyl-CoA reductase-like NADH-dependent reductase (Old Yellow Enzyme family) [Natronocella acetinitrilica]